MKKAVFTLLILILPPLLSLVFPAGAAATPIPRIVNGIPAPAAGSPFARIILYSTDGSRQLCSGTMLTQNAVLTAAHCFLLEDIKGATITIGKTSVRAKRVLIHPDVNIDPTIPAVYNDVAVLFLARPLRTRTMPLLASAPLSAGQSFAIFGYGVDAQGRLASLRTGEMTATTVANGQIEAVFVGTNSDTCSGDSGGPAVLTLRTRGRVRSGIVGIASSGSEADCGVGDRSLFTYTQDTAILQFILDIVPQAKVV